MNIIQVWDIAGVTNLGFCELMCYVADTSFALTTEAMLFQSDQYNLFIGSNNAANNNYSSHCQCEPVNIGWETALSCHRPPLQLSSLLADTGCPHPHPLRASMGQYEFESQLEAASRLQETRVDQLVLPSKASKVVVDHFF